MEGFKISFFWNLCSPMKSSQGVDPELTHSYIFLHWRLIPSFPQLHICSFLFSWVVSFCFMFFPPELWNPCCSLCLIYQCDGELALPSLSTSGASVLTAPHLHPLHPLCYAEWWAVMTCSNFHRRKARILIHLPVICGKRCGGRKFLKSLPHLPFSRNPE